MDENSLTKWGGLYPRVLCPDRAVNARSKIHVEICISKCMYRDIVAGHCEFIKYGMFSLII